MEDFIRTICTGSKTQEIALGTNYLRAHANDSLSSQSGWSRNSILERIHRQQTQSSHPSIFF